ncbi:glycoside hydrolase family 16 protein [Bipolaris victoriae FI3]|uniref:Nicotinate-nucleotide pyrophosphorylase [carboxylating] n=1 Tax=Bipolaris victoriae (strain FI3) TaxID=930091 RepID=W7EFD7_BIPV3|nr:glycoside hydrolase family 16 protein [Bipolaris victoriae FI3]
MQVSEGAPAHGAVAHLLPQTYKRLVSEWLEEDTPSFDYGGFVVGEEMSEAKLLGKSEGIVAGVPFFDEVFRQLGCTVEWHVKEGTSFQPITHCATVRGPVRHLLLGERVALNTLARCSGIATKSHRLLTLLRGAGYPNILAGTRKTTPGFRLVEKYGMLVGGVDAHRVDLSAMTMLKDNHIVAAGSITNAVKAAKAAGGFAIKVEVECQSFEEADEAIAAGADIVMLDNFTPEGVQVAAKDLKDKWGRGVGDRKQFLVEVSGGLTEHNVEKYVCGDIDIVSTSSIHQGVPHVDFSLKIVPKSKKTALAVLSLPLLTTAHPTPTANTTNTTIYTLTDDLSSKNFFPSFSLFSSPDPTNGFVQYQNLSSAASASLLGYLSPNNSIYLGVDHTTKDASGRASLRLESNKSWNRGLLVADIRHMPASQCGVWPAFWMLSASKTWPEGGEIDILEGVNEAQGNVVTLHTSAGCVVEDRAGAGEFAGTMVTRNCDVDAPGQGKNAGCSIRAPDSGERVQMGIVREDMGEARAPSYGTGFNDAKGGVYAMEWTESSISVWFFPRDSPGYTEYFSQSNDTAVTSLDPSTWGPPMARFSGSGCDFSERFVDMKIVFNTAFCGEWAGKVWDEECAAKTGVETCEEYVRGNPDAFREAYWEVEGLRWFQKS